LFYQPCTPAQLYSPETLVFCFWYSFYRWLKILALPPLVPKNAKNTLKIPIFKSQAFEMLARLAG
jgi:hypothetical protein